MNTSVRDAQLVAYPRPVNHPGSERYLKGVMYGALFVQVFSLTLSFVYSFAYTMHGAVRIRSQYEVSRLMDGSTFLLCQAILIGVVCLGVYVSIRFLRMHRHFYLEVPQGKIVELTITSNIARITHDVVLEGYNRVNQVRRDSWSVNAKKWFDNVYVVGEYAQFPETEQE